MKVAEALLNPYGDDDQDFDVNFLIDRNLQVCLVSFRLVGTQFDFFQVGFLFND